MMVNLGNLNWIFQCFSHLEQVDWKRFLAWIFAEMFIWNHFRSGTSKNGSIHQAKWLLVNSCSSPSLCFSWKWNREFTLSRNYSFWLPRIFGLYLERILWRKGDLFHFSSSVLVLSISINDLCASNRKETERIDFGAECSVRFYSCFPVSEKHFCPKKKFGFCLCFVSLEVDW